MERRADRNGGATESNRTLAADVAPHGFRTLRAGDVFLRVATDYETQARSLGLLEPGGLEALLISKTQNICIFNIVDDF